MSTLTLTKTKLREGHWEGVITPSGDTVPQVEVLHQGKQIEGVSLVRNLDAAWEASAIF